MTDSVFFCFVGFLFILFSLPFVLFGEPGFMLISLLAGWACIGFGWFLYAEEGEKE